MVGTKNRCRVLQAGPSTSNDRMNRSPSIDELYAPRSIPFFLFYILSGAEERHAVAPW